MKEDGFKNVAIIGLGLLGSSIALALKKFSPNTKIIAFSSNPSKIQQIPELQKVIDESFQYGNWENLNDSDIVVICTPIKTIPQFFQQIQDFVRMDTIITDVGSTKAWLLEEIKKIRKGGKKFIGSHPMAGSEKTGAEYGNPNLFLKKIVAITPYPEEDSYYVNRLKQFWEMLGAITIIIDSETHDKYTSLTSHLVHFLAFSYINFLMEKDEGKEKYRRLYSSGLLDTTRIAKSSENIWMDIFETNIDNLISDAEDFIRSFQKFLSLLKYKNFETLKEKIRGIREYREELERYD